MADEAVKIATGAPPAPDPLADLMAALKWDKFAMAPASERSPGEALEMLLEDLAEKGADDTVRSRLRRMGAERVLRMKTLPKDLVGKVPGGDMSLKMARESLRGIQEQKWGKSIGSTLDIMRKSGEFDERILGEIEAGVKKLGPERFAQVPVQQVVRTMAERGEGGRLSNLWAKVTHRAPMGKVGEAAKAAAAAGPAVAPATRATLKAGGIRGTGPKISKLGALGAIAGAAYTAKQAYETFIAPDTGQARALQGTTSGGKPVTSLEYLRARQEADDRLMERKAVLMQNEPGILEQLARTLSQSEDTGPLTKSEMAIGNVARTPSRTRPNPTSILDQLLSEL